MNIRLEQPKGYFVADENPEAFEAYEVTFPQMADKLPIAYISSVDQEGFPWTKASIYFCDAKGFKGMMLRGTMEVLTDAASKEMIWHNGDTEYYPGGVTDPNYCVLKFTATDGRFYSDFYPRSFVIE